MNNNLDGNNFTQDNWTKNCPNQKKSQISATNSEKFDISEISAYSDLREDKNKEFYEMKSQYLSDEIFFAKLNKRTFNNTSNEPFLTGYQLTVNRENSDNKSLNESEKNLFDFLKTGSFSTTIILLIVSTIGGGNIYSIYLIIYIYIYRIILSSVCFLLFWNFRRIPLFFLICNFNILFNILACLYILCFLIDYLFFLKG